MRPKIVVSVLLVTLAILVILLLIRPASKTAVSTPEIDISKNTTPKDNLANQTVLGVTPQPIAAQTNIRPTAVNNKKTPAAFQQYIESKNSDIEFYGQVVDQNSNPISGADIKIGIRQWYVPLPGVLNEEGRTIQLEQSSDANGRFEFHGATGDGFGVGITKEGYELEPNRYGFGPAAGSHDDPVVFKMWGTNVHEQLITGNKSFEIVPDGRPYFVNLTDGSISEREGGDLKIWIQYTNQVVPGQLYDWSAGIEVVKGGLWEVPQAAINSGFLDESPFAMYSAPTDGYTPSFSLKNKIKGGQSGEIGNRYFYLLLNNGNEYGRMSINLFAPYGSLHPGLIRLSYAINPSGSRILR